LTDYRQFLSPFDQYAVLPVRIHMSL
jgi:hypothetical protein